MLSAARYRGRHGVKIIAKLKISFAIEAMISPVVPLPRSYSLIKTALSCPLCPIHFADFQCVPSSIFFFFQILHHYSKVL